MKNRKNTDDIIEVRDIVVIVDANDFETDEINDTHDMIEDANDTTGIDNVPPTFNPQKM